MQLTLQRYQAPLRLLLTVLAGAFLALVLNRLWGMETRFFAAAVLGIAAVGVSMPFLPRFSDYLLAALFFSVPLTAFAKYLFLSSYSDREQGIMRFSGAFNVGPVDLVLAALFAMWLIRVLVTRTDQLPRLERPDLLVALLVVAYVLSIPGAPDRAAAIFALGYLGRYLLVYLYVSRNFHRRHIPWLVLAIGVTILVESGLAGIQATTGKWVGLALDRGRGVRLDEQYTVPGIESRHRATGTVSESHTFGIYMTMLVAYAFLLTFYRGVPRMVRNGALVLFALGAASIALSLSRSAWLSSGIALLLLWAVRIWWGERQLILPTLLVPFLLTPALPWAVQILIERFSGQSELITERFDQYPVAWAIWQDHFFFGFGVGNYMKALERYNITGAAELPVHNVFLWCGAETGLLGVIAFFGIIFTTILRSWKLAVRGDEPVRRVALAVMAGVLAYFIDGLSDPLYREPVVYMMFWLSVGLSVALVRIAREAPA